MSHEFAAPDEDDLSAWQELTSEVAPLQKKERAPAPATPRPYARMRRADATEVLAESLYAPVEPEDWETGAESQFRRPQVAPGTLRRLRRGQFRIQADLDLHGHNRREAHAAVLRFLEDARLEAWTCVRIIHGKGQRSPQGRPVLKSRVEISLEQHDDVLAYGSAPAWAGGHGALLVLLRRSR